MTDGARDTGRSPLTEQRPKTAEERMTVDELFEAVRRALPVIGKRRHPAYRALLELAYRADEERP